MFRLMRLWRLAGQDVRLLWFALRHPARPPWLLPASLLLLCYALEPLNFALPLFGAVDELLLLPLLLHLLLRGLPPVIRSAYAQRAG